MGRQLERIGYSAESLDIEGSHEETLAEVYSRGLFEPDASLVFNLMKSQHPSYEALEGAQLSNELAAHGDWPARKKADARPVEYLESAIAEFGEAPMYVNSLFSPEISARHRILPGTERSSGGRSQRSLPFGIRR